MKKILGGGFVLLFLLIAPVVVFASGITDLRSVISSFSSIFTYNSTVATYGVNPPGSAINPNEWPMAGANLERTSHNSVGVGGSLSPEWYRVIDPYIDDKVQVIAADNKIFVSTSKGLYAFNANDGAQLWVYGTEMPLGHSPTYSGGVLYVGGHDRRLYAINASNGTLKSNWTFYEAGGGYETNPIVVDNVVMLGNRDGYFYAFYADTGVLKWKYKTGGPVRFSAAYKNGVVYFGADDNVAYALNSADGTLKWKTPTPGSPGALPGVGFTSYWPVIYTDYVIFSGSKKATRGWFHDTPGKPEYNFETYHDPNNMFAGNSGCTSPDSVYYSCSMISNYFNTKKEQRNFFLFNAFSGQEFTTVYPPINWAGVTRGGNKYPPTVGGDNALYTLIGYNNSGPSSTTGADGWIAGWEFGTSIIRKIWNDSAAGDEPTAFTSGGNFIYWGEGVNHEMFGTVDITKSVGSNHYFWDPRGPLFSNSKYTSLDLGGKFGGGTGVYSYFDGVTNFSPIPYNNKLYLIVGNALVAMSSVGGSRNAGTSVAPTTLVSQTISVTKAELTQKLETEIQKIIAAGHLRPGFMDSGILSDAMGDGNDTRVEGNYLNQYFSTPAETLYTLAAAIPHLSTSTQTSLKTYLQSEQSNFLIQNVTHIGWKNGAKRELYDDLPEITKTISVSDGCQNSFCNHEVPSDPRNYFRSYNQLAIIPANNTSYLLPEAFYGAWKYAQVFPVQASTLFNAMKAKLPKAGTNNDMTDINLNSYPYILNQYIVGYRGYLELEKLAGVTSNISQSTQYGEYTRLLNLRMANFNENSPLGNGVHYANSLNVSRNFMYMVPELALEFRTNKLSAVQQAINTYQVLTPYWFISKYTRTYGEGGFHHLYDRLSLFLTRAYVLQQPFSELVKYLDVPAFERGDLHYIQNLVAALQAP